MHKPELWGYVQFSEHHVLEGSPGAVAGCSRSSSGSSTRMLAEREGGQGVAVQPAAPAWPQFMPDPSWPIRAFLMEVYYKQQVREGAGVGVLWERGAPGQV